MFKILASSLLVTAATAACDADALLEVQECLKSSASTTDPCVLAQTLAACQADNGCADVCKANQAANEAALGADCKLDCSSSGCFPAHATVELENGETKTMDQVAIGDSLRVGHNEFSEVYFFSTSMAETKSKFAVITASNSTLMMTANHYLYVNGELAPARDVVAGDMIVLANGDEVSVTKVAMSWEEGLFNPHTLNGDIVVNGVKTSTYTTAVHPTIAHALLAPLRGLYAAGITFGEKFSTSTKNLPTWVLQAISA